MHIEPAGPTTKNPASQFAGDVWLDPIALPHEPDQTMVVATVRFAPGARTAWHSHKHGQYLRVTQGVGRFDTGTEKSSKSTPARQSTPHPGRNTGTPPPPAASWNTSPCSETAKTLPKRPSGVTHHGRRVQRPATCLTGPLCCYTVSGPHFSINNRKGEIVRCVQPLCMEPAT